MSSGPVVQWIPACLPAGIPKADMIYLYVIRSEKNGDLYVGICKDVGVRVKEHNSGKNRYTKGLIPWKLLLVDEYADWQKARLKEKYYKSGSGKEYLKKILVP